MAQDYWRGGWAQSGMQSLPGTQGAAAHKVEYNPLHALADILGAYWQKKGYEGSMSLAAGIGDRMDAELKQAQEGTPAQWEQTPVQPTQEGQAVRDNAVQSMQQTGQLENPDFLGANQNTGSLLGAAQQIASMNPNAEDAAAVQRGMAASEMAANGGQLQNPMQEYGFTGQQTAPAQPPTQLTYQEYANRANALKSEAMMSIAKKYGAQYAPMAEKMIDDAINQRLSAYGESVLSDKRKDLFRKNRPDIDTPAGRMAFRKDAEEYNILAKKMGMEGFSSQFLKDYLDSNARKQSTVNLGNRVAVVESPANGGRFDDGSSIRVAGELATGISPSESENLKLKREKMAQDQGNADRDYVLRFNQWRTNVDMAMKKLEQQATSGGGGVSTAQISAAKAAVDAYSKWETNNRAMNPDATNPYEQDAQAAMSLLRSAMGVQTGQGGSEKPAADSGDPVGNWINEAYKRGYSKEQIQAKLREKGYGDRYDSWLWN